MSPVDLVHGRVKLSEVSLHYVTVGEGEPVVLLHGFPQTWFTWRRVIPALAERYTVIAPDLRGLGDSTKPQGGYDKRTVAGDIHELVRALGHGRIRLVGHDIGGWVAYPYAAMYPEEVEKLVILQALAPGYGLQRNMQEAWHFRFHMELDLPEALVSGRERIYLNHFLSGGIYDRSAISPEALDEYVRCFSTPGAARAFFNYYRALPQDAKDNEELAKKKLPMPVLALGGEFGEGDSVLDSVKQVAEDVRGGIVERAGHFIPEERPDQLVKLMLDFFKW
jgi:pimeloyl-ACP methyl ester carboxylesterase